MWLNVNKKILQTKYREGQVEYFGKKSMSVLRTMLVQWKLRSSINIGEEKIFQGFKYIFTNYVFKGYSGQDHVKVASIIKELVKKVKEQFI